MLAVPPRVCQVPSVRHLLQQPPRGFLPMPRCWLGPGIAPLDVSLCSGRRTRFLIEGRTRFLWEEDSIFFEGRSRFLPTYEELRPCTHACTQAQGQRWCPELNVQLVVVCDVDSFWQCVTDHMWWIVMCSDLRLHWHRRVSLLREVLLRPGWWRQPRLRPPRSGQEPRFPHLLQGKDGHAHCQLQFRHKPRLKRTHAQPRCVSMSGV